MDSLLDPDSLRNRDDITFRGEQSVDDQDDFEYFDAISGMAAVGILNERGEILLMNSPHGWRLPYGPVEAGADWVTVGRRYGTVMTGVDIMIRRVERATEISRRLKGGSEETTSYDVVLSSVPVEGQPVASTPAFGPWNTVEVAWFSDLPDDAYWEHGDVVEDIRRFLNRNAE